VPKNLSPSDRRSQGLQLKDASLSARLLQAQDRERRRISRELHDSVGQSLAAIQMALEKAVRSGKGSPESLTECLGFVQGAIREVRTVSYLLQPPTLDLLGLSAAVCDYAEGFNKRSTINIRVEIPKDFPRLGEERENAIFRIIQESLTNVH